MSLNFIAGLPSLDIVAGMMYGDFIAAAIIMGVALLAAFLINLLLHIYLAVIARKTGTLLDDLAVSALKKPVYLTAIITGGYFALLQFDVMASRALLARHVYVAALIAILAYAASKVFGAFVSWQMKKSSGAESEVARHFLPFTRRLATVFIYVIAFIALLDQFNVKITALVASLGVASLAIALALQDTLANFFAGVYVMADKPVRVGDFIRLENGEDGYVEDVGWRSTRVRTLPNNIIVIPNSRLAQSTIINYYLPSREMSFVTKCGVAYGSDLEKVEKVTVAVAKEVQQTVDGATRNFEPFIRFNEFGDSNINFSIIMRVNEPVAKYLALHELVKRLSKAYKREGIEVSWPVRKVHLSK